MTRRRHPDIHPRQAVERHFAHVKINTAALVRAKEKALQARKRMANYPKKGGEK